MGSKDLFHKRKAKASADLGRKKAKRSLYDKVLIVCEGEKTEPNYFRGLISHYELNSANVAIDGRCGSSPKSVYKRTLDLYTIEKNKGDPFDRVYCVFDKDTHTTYVETVASINSKKPKDVFFHVTSVPCFEYWILLHFDPTTRTFQSTSNYSAADNVIRELKQYLPDYEKGNTGLFDSLFPQLDFALANATRVNRQADHNETDNPTTQIGVLVEYLRNLKS